MNRQGIEGVPDHLKVTGYRPVKYGEYRLVCVYGGGRADGAKWNVQSTSTGLATIVEPDNVYNVYNLADVEIPEGYEFVEFRDVVAGDSYIAKHRTLIESSTGPTFHDDQRRIIVKPVAKKTRRFLVAEQEIGDMEPSRCVVHYRKGGDGNAYPLPFRIEEREIDQDAYNKGLGELGTY